MIWDSTGCMACPSVHKLSLIGVKESNLCVYNPMNYSLFGFLNKYSQIPGDNLPFSKGPNVGPIPN